MFGSAILDVAIGVVFVFLLVSTICTAIREGIEAQRGTRAAYLEYGIRELLHDRGGEGLARALFEHPLVHGLFLGNYEPLAEVGSAPLLAKGRGKPSYIPARTFAIALMDIAARGPKTDLVSSDPGSPRLSLESVRANILNLRNPAVQRIMLYALDSANGDLDVARTNLETWFDSGMERVSGWYKRSTQWIVFMIALVVTMALNVDTIQIAKSLYRDEGARHALVEQAQQATKQSEIPPKEAAATLTDLDLPMGWSSKQVPNSILAWVARALGWLMTALAATLGAPFWFDTLNKFMVVRSTVKPNEKSGEEASKDGPSRSESEAQAVLAIARAAGNGANRSHAGLATVVASTLRDDESHIDACDVPMDDETRDDELPVATGGVA